MEKNEKKGFKICEECNKDGVVYKTMECRGYLRRGGAQELSKRELEKYKAVAIAFQEIKQTGIKIIPVENDIVFNSGNDNRCWKRVLCCIKDFRPP